MIASWAVTKTSGTAAAAELVERFGDGGDVPLVDEHAVGEPSSTDDPEDPVAGGKPTGSRPAGDDRTGHLDARDVGWRTGRSGIATLALCDVRRIQPGVADGDEDVVSTGTGSGRLDRDR